MIEVVLNFLLNFLATYWVNLLFVFLACLMNAGMDSLQSNYSTSFARNWSHSFWNPTISWENKHKLPEWIPDAFTDGWHLLKMVMLGFLFISASNNVTNSFWTDLILFGMYSVMWNVPFPLLYTKLRFWNRK